MTSWTSEPSAVGPWGFESPRGLCKRGGFEEKGWEVPPEAEGGVLGQGGQEEWPGWDAAGAMVQRHVRDMFDILFLFAHCSHCRVSKVPLKVLRYQDEAPDLQDKGSFCSRRGPRDQHLTPGRVAEPSLGTGSHHFSCRDLLPSCRPLS